MNHAILSPSSSHRWLICTPSARLEQGFPDTNSDVAAEGTFAHLWAEIQLCHFHKQMSDEDFKAEIAHLTQNKFYSKGLEEYVALYIDTVIEKFHKAIEVDKGATLLLEQKFNLNDYVPECYGHADAVILVDGNMEVVDLKYGAGVSVSASNNPQLRLYALGAYSELAFLYDIKQVTMTIVQPRNGGISSETLAISDLLNWADTIKQIAQLAFKGEGNFKAGEHCKFCKAANRCKAFADYQLAVVKNDFDTPDLLTDEDLTHILSRADSIIKWLNNIKNFMLTAAVNLGKHWKGFKLVEGRSVRKITDADKAAEILKDNGGTDEQIWKPKELLNLTTLEKNFGKKKLAEMLKPVIEKPAGAPTLVPVTDPRAEWHNSKNDFDKLEM